MISRAISTFIKKTGNLVLNLAFTKRWIWLAMMLLTEYECYKVFFYIFILKFV